MGDSKLVVINASFEIHFTESTIWKHIIQLNTNSAFKKFVYGYSASYIVEKTINNNDAANEQQHLPCSSEVATNLTRMTSSDTFYTNESTTDSQEDDGDKKGQQQKRNKESSSNKTIIFCFSIVFVILITQQLYLITQMTNIHQSFITAQEEKMNEMNNKFKTL